MNGPDKKYLHLFCAVLVFASSGCLTCNSVSAQANKQTRGKSVKSAECDAYAGRLHSKIYDVWEYSEGSNVATLSTTINADGTTGDVRMSSNPSNQAAEQAANEAFVKALPLEPLPKALGNSANLTVEFHSSSNLHGDTSGTINIRLEPSK